MLTAKVFQSGNSQAIRIPKEVQTTMKEFNIKKIGEAYILFPKDDPWFRLHSSIGTMPPDYMKDRGQSEALPSRDEFSRVKNLSLEDWTLG